MTQAIITKYIPATNTKPSRIKAWCEKGSITACYNNHTPHPERATVAKLIARFGAEDAVRGSSHISPWCGHWVGGAAVIGGKKVQVWVKADTEDKVTFVRTITRK